MSILKSIDIKVAGASSDVNPLLVQPESVVLNLVIEDGSRLKYDLTNHVLKLVNSAVAEHIRKLHGHTL